MHPFHAFLHDRQAHASAGINIRCMKALEHAENSSLMFGWDADAIVLDPNANKIAPQFAPDIHVLLGPWLYKFESVAEQVAQDKFQCRRVRLHCEEMTF